MRTVWKTIEYHRGADIKLKPDELAGECCNNVIKLAMLRGSHDNISVVLVFFRNVFA